jgi:hypothetical protein
MPHSQTISTMADDTDDGVEVLALSGVGNTHTAQSHYKPKLLTQLQQADLGGAIKMSGRNPWQ